MSASQYYEVRCEHCRTSFPPETRRCIHCGQPIGSRSGRLVPGAGSPPGEGSEEDEEALPGSRARNVLWLVTAAIAIAMSALRTCTQG